MDGLGEGWVRKWEDRLEEWVDEKMNDWIEGIENGMKNSF